VMCVAWKYFYKFVKRNWRIKIILIWRHTKFLIVVSRYYNDWATMFL